MTEHRTFPDALLVPSIGRLSCDGPSAWSLTIPLEPFSADDEHDPLTWRPGTDGPDVIESAITAEGLALPGSTFSELVAKDFSFPVNPTDGCIDASIYLGAAHNPVDITKLEFGALTRDLLAARITCTLLFEIELGAVLNREAVLDVMVRP